MKNFTFSIYDYSNILMMLGLWGVLAQIRQKSFYLVCFLFSYPLLLVYEKDELAFFVVLILLFILVRLRNIKKNKNVLFSELLPFTTTIMINYFTDFISFYIVEIGILKKIKHIAQITLHYSIMETVINLFLMLITGYYLKKLLDNKFQDTQLKRSLAMQIGMFDLLAILEMEIWKRTNFFNDSNDAFLAFLLIQATFSVILMYLDFKKDRVQAERANLNTQLSMMNIYIQEIEKDYQNLRKFRHDYKNLLLGLDFDVQDSASKRYLQELNLYSKKLLDEKKVLISDVQNIKNDAVKNLIITKLLMGIQKKLKVSFLSPNLIKYINLEDVILIRVLGILLDNAIEGALKSRNKLLIVEIINNNEGVTFAIKNSLAENINPQNIENIIKKVIREIITV